MARLVDIDKCDRDLFYKQCGGKDSLITVETAFNMLMSLPVEYDIDKVVEQLEKVKGHACDGNQCKDCKYDEYCEQGEFSQYLAIYSAIEIVKRGGI